MFNGIGPIPNLTVPLLLAVIGAVVGWWIENLIVQRRIKKHGLYSERLLRKLAENVRAKLPEKISLIEVTPCAWSDPVKYELLASALQQLGFRRSGVFRGTPQKWIVEFWLSTEPGIFATIFDRHSKNDETHLRADFEP